MACVTTASVAAAQLNCADILYSCALSKYLATYTAFAFGSIYAQCPFSMPFLQRSHVQCLKSTKLQPALESALPFWLSIAAVLIYASMLKLLISDMLPGWFASQEYVSMQGNCLTEAHDRAKVLLVCSLFPQAGVSTGALPAVQSVPHW